MVQKREQNHLNAYIICCKGFHNEDSKFFILSKLIHYYVGPTAYGIFSKTVKV